MSHKKMSNKSSIEWFDEQLCKRMAFEDIEVANWYLEIFNQAKEMHKQEIMNASDRFANSIDFTIEDFEQYYNETFGK